MEGEGLMFTANELMGVMKLDGYKDRIVAFQPNHIHMAEFRDFDQEILDGYGRPHIQDYAVDGLSYTAMCDGKVYAMFGLYPLWKGVAEAWLLPSAKLENRKMVFHKACLRFFPYASEKLNLHRIQVYVRSSNVQAVKWIEMMYFNREGLLKRYGPDINDYYCYGRLF